MKLAIFDLDSTLIAGDSDHAWGQFIVKKGIVDGDVFTQKNDYFYEQYKQQTLDIHEYQRFVLTPLMAFNKEELNALHKEFMATMIAPLRLPKADALIAQHQAAGDQLLLITATNRFVAGPIGEWLGIQQILATEPEEQDGFFTGNIVGTPCFQQGKITRLQLWLDSWEDQASEMCFYSDSSNDLPLLKHVDRPIAVDPDDNLKHYAESQNWPVISLRD